MQHIRQRIRNDIAIRLAALLVLVLNIEESSFADNIAGLDAAKLIRPPVPGEFRLTTRTRPRPKNNEGVEAFFASTKWKTSETAIIVCDMWDDHYCKMAAQRVGIMVPRLNATLSDARSAGAMIIHSPSGTTDFYKSTSHRLRMELIPKVKAPFPIDAWCHRDIDREPELPLDVSKEPCDDPIPGPAVRVFNRQHAGIDIVAFDGISDRGDEIISFCKTHSIKNIAITGVHTNMCVLGRPFGIRQLVKLGFNVVLVRDLTDTMYDPRQPPHVSHARGTELVIEHIEKYWCPSILSKDLQTSFP